MVRRSTIVFVAGGVFVFLRFVVGTIEVVVVAVAVVVAVVVVVVVIIVVVIGVGVDRYLVIGKGKCPSSNINSGVGITAAAIIQFRLELLHLLGIFDSSVFHLPYFLQQCLLLTEMAEQEEGRLVIAATISTSTSRPASLGIQMLLLLLLLLLLMARAAADVLAGTALSKQRACDGIMMAMDDVAAFIPGKQDVGLRGTTRRHHACTCIVVSCSKALGGSRFARSGWALLDRGLGTRSFSIAFISFLLLFQSRWCHLLLICY